MNNQSTTDRQLSFPGLLVVTVSFLLLSGCSIAPAPKMITESVAGAGSGTVRSAGLVLSKRSLEPVKNETLRTPEGSNFKLAELSGKVVLVDVWATFCGPCREQIPKLTALRTKYKDKGLEIVGLNVDEEKDLGLVKEFVKKLSINYPVGRGRGSFESAFLSGTEDETGAPPIPQLFVFSRDGRLVEHFVGVRAGDDVALEKIVNQELAASPAAQVR